MAIFDVIKYEGDNNTFVWKHPREDFNTNSQLIVHESQEAILFLNGQALDLFGPGRYTLETQNLPLLGSLIKFATLGKSPFHCEVYFINKTVQMSLRWGTDSKVRFIDPTYGLPFEIGACGEMNLAVSDSRKLLTKLVGTTKGIAWGDHGSGFTKSLQNCFRPLISTSVKAHLPAVIKANSIDLLEIDENLESLSQSLRSKIVGGFEEYGLTIPQFYITGVLLPEDDANFRKMKELHTLSFQTKVIQAETLVKTVKADADAEVVSAQRKIEIERQTTETEVARRAVERDLIRAQGEAEAIKLAGMAEAEVMQAKGYSQRDVLQADVQKAFAEGVGNMTITGGGGGIASDMIGLSVGMATAGAVAPQIGDMLKGVTSPVATNATPATAKCQKCGADLPATAKFCLQCGEKVAAAEDDTVVCPQCGNTVNKGKFCPECGHKFVTACPKCGAAVSPGAKFCFECGEKL